MVLSIVISKRSNISELDKESFLERFETFFAEFKEEGTSSWLFYLIFVIRRFSIVCIIFLIETPVIQMTLSFSFTLMVIFTQIPAYLLTQKPFLEGVTSWYIVLNELLTCVFYSVLSLGYISPIQLSAEETSSMSIKIILTALCLNIFSNLVLTYKNLSKRCRRKKVAVQEEINTGESNISPGLNNHVVTGIEVKPEPEKKTYQNYIE